MTLETISHVPQRIEKKLKKVTKRVIPLATNERYLRLGMLFKLQDLQAKNQITETEASYIRDKIQTSDRLIQLRKDLGATLAIEAAGSLYAWIITPALLAITKDPVTSVFSGYLLFALTREAYFAQSDFKQIQKARNDKDKNRLIRAVKQSVVDIGTGWIPPAVLPTIVQIIYHEHSLWPLFKPRFNIFQKNNQTRKETSKS